MGSVRSLLRTNRIDDENQPEPFFWKLKSCVLHSSSTYHNDSFITSLVCRRSSARTLWHQRQTYLSLVPQGCLWTPPRERCSPGSRTGSPWLPYHPYRAPECALVQSRKLWHEAALLGPSLLEWAYQGVDSVVWGQRGWFPASECTAAPPRCPRHKPEAYPGSLLELVSIQKANKTSVKTWNVNPPGQKSATLIATISVLRGQARIGTASHEDLISKMNRQKNVQDKILHYLQHFSRKIVVSNPWEINVFIDQDPNGFWSV